MLTEKPTAGGEGLLTVSQSFRAQLSPPTDLGCLFSSQHPGSCRDLQHEIQNLCTSKAPIAILENQGSGAWAAAAGAGRLRPPGVLAHGPPPPGRPRGTGWPGGRGSLRLEAGGVQGREPAAGRSKAGFCRAGRPSTPEGSPEGDGGLAREATGLAPWEAGSSNGWREGRPGHHKPITSLLRVKARDRVDPFC